jgi:CheY-like chemotaxis protein
MEKFGSGQNADALNPPRGNWILAVEDSDSDMYLLQRIMNAAATNQQVRRVRDGEQAIELLQHLSVGSPESLPELIVIDLNLPRVDGYEVLAQLRAYESLKEIPILVVTSSQTEADHKRALACGADGYFVKPMDIASYERLPHAMEEARRVRLKKLHPPDSDR